MEHLKAANSTAKNRSRSMCCFYECKRNRARYPNLNMFAFPTKRPTVCEAWVKNCANESLDSLSTKTLSRKEVCEKHFEDSCFQSTIKSKIHPWAVPTLFSVEEIDSPKLVGGNATQMQPSSLTRTQASSLPQDDKRTPGCKVLSRRSPVPTSAMQFLDSIQIILVQNLFWWTVMCSSLMVLLRFFVITSLADHTAKPHRKSKSEAAVASSGAAVWVVVHGGGCSGGEDAQRGCNFLVSSGGEVAEGRGWGVAGSTHNNSIDIYLIGDYQDESPPEQQVAAVQQLITAGVNGGHIAAEYKLVGHRQVQSQQPTSSCPGNVLYTMVQRWPRYAAHVE